MEHVKITIELKHEENLRKLATGLRGDLPAGKQFDMSNYSTGAATGLYETECGAVACGIGFATIFVKPKLPGENYLDFSYRLFGEDFDRLDIPAWDWCFAADWAGIDNTQVGVAERIEYVLDKGLPALAGAGLGLHDAIAYYKGYVSPNSPAA